MFKDPRTSITIKTDKDPFYNIADWRREVYDAKAKYTVWGETDTILPRDIFAILDPRAFPIAILPFPSKVDMIDINISGADVAIPIKIKLEMKYDILNFLEIFSVVVTRRFAP